MKKVRWSLWEPNGAFHNGDMPEKDTQYWLNEFGQEAKEMVRDTGADHVVYGVKRFGKDGGLDSVQFYLIPMDDKDFRNMVASNSDSAVYAVHARYAG